MRDDEADDEGWTEKCRSCGHPLAEGEVGECDRCLAE